MSLIFFDASSMMTITDLEEALSRPTPRVLEMFSRLRGDILFLGVAGKMGPSMAQMARRAADETVTKRRIIGVSRFGNSDSRRELEACGVETIACDLLDETALSNLPDAPNVVFMAGMKFGASGNEPLTWAMNTHLPSLVCKRWRHSRIAAFSTGNVYGLRHIAAGGSRETDAPNPVGEYAMSCLGRERMFEHFSTTLNLPVALIRLNYACDLRYGVLVDIARKVWNGEPVDLGMAWFNTIWQGDANAYSLLALEMASSPASKLNLTGAATLRVREMALRFSECFGKPVQFSGEEGASALLNDASSCFERFGPPTMNEEELIEHVAAWISKGGALLNKPTHFESRDGKF